MKNVIVAVCDDEPAVCGQVKTLVDEILDGGICRTFDSCGKLIETMESGETAPDIVILDIEWDGEERGIAAASRLKELSPHTKVIYLTGYTQKYVQQVFLFPSNLSGFLMKPVDPKLLEENLNKALQNGKSERFTFQYRGNRYSLNMDEICFLESFGHKISIFTAKENYQMWGRLDEVEALFPSCFVRCHKSYLVNLNRMQKLDIRHRFLAENGREIPVSKSRYQEVREAYFRNGRDAVFGASEEAVL